VFKNRKPREIFGSKRVEVTGDWRKPHNKEPNNTYYSPDVIRIRESSGMGCEGHARTEMHTEFWSGTIRKEYLGRSKRRREYHIKSVLKV
jgi:hypothetical protein